MYFIDKEKFGTFIAQLRKEKGMMQKELAEKLYVSDKAVSKWERGLSIPDVALLVPLSELLGVTVTELLEGRRIPKEEAMDSDQTEELVQKVIGMTAEENRGGRPNRGLWLLGAAAVGSLELWLLTLLGVPWEELMVSLGIMMLLMAVFGVYFCVFARERLPKYYDENKISSFSDGPLRMNLPGVYFNNNNWPYILKAGQLWCLLGLVLSPVVFYLLRTFLPKVWGAASVYIILFMTLGGLFIPMTVAARKYESAPEQPRSRRSRWRDWAWVAVILAVVGISLLTTAMAGSFGSGSDLKVGWTETSGSGSWSASYAYYDGWQQRTMNWSGEAAILYAEVYTESGELNLTVTDAEGKTLFSRENIGTADLEIPIEGKVMVQISTEGHKGSFSIRCGP